MIKWMKNLNVLIDVNSENSNERKILDLFQILYLERIDTRAFILDILS